MKILLNRNTKLVGGGTEPTPGTVLLATLTIKDADVPGGNTIKKVQALGVVVTHKQTGDEDTYYPLLLTAALGEPAYLLSDNGFRYKDAMQVLPGCKIQVRALQFAADSEIRNVPGQICVTQEGLVLLCSRPNEPQSIKALNLTTWRLEKPPADLYRHDVWLNSWELVCLDDSSRETIILKR